MADPGHHSYQDCLVSLVFSWELGIGCYPPWMHLVPGKTVTPLEVDMLDIVEEARARSRLDRVASFRQLQGLSKQLSVLTDGRVTVDWFDLPSTCNVRPVAFNEKRAVVPESSGTRELHVLINTETGSQVPVVPLDLTNVRLLNLMLDQGSIGTAGVAFASFHLQKLISAKFDKIHRLVRDLKDAEQACLGGLFTKTKLWSSYLLGLNNRPFNSGANATLKRRMLELFLLQDPLDKPAFAKYVSLMAKAWDMPCHTRDDREAILTRVTELPSFVRKMGQPKLQNWFSWNQQMWDHQLKDFYATKMIFEDQFPDEPDPDETDPFGTSAPAGRDPRAQLRAIIQHGGGVRLAYRLMSRELHSNEKILWVAEKACWDWYSSEIINTKTPQQAVLYSVRLSNGGWAAEEHLCKTFANVLRDPAYLREMDIPLGESDLSRRAVLIEGLEFE